MSSAGSYERKADRRLLGPLCRAAASTVITGYRAASGRPDAVPGRVGAIQTFGQLLHAHSHIHAFTRAALTTGGGPKASQFLILVLQVPLVRGTLGVVTSTSMRVIAGWFGLPS